MAEKPAHYLRRVLRVTVAQRIVLFNGDGHDYLAEVVRSGKKKFILSVIDRVPAAMESELRIIVVQAICRGERMDQTLQKCTELGVAAFQPLFSERVEVRFSTEKMTRRLDHWKGVVVSACEQSGRAVVPEVLEPLDFAEWINKANAGQRLVLAPGAETPLARVVLQGQLQIAAGPEGGFSDSEQTSMGSHGVESVSLGPRMLRTETAAPAAVAVLQALAGDFA
jgi:16S rRNA (uracil1498-N3)-methyltransferase